MLKPSCGQRGVLAEARAHACETLSFTMLRYFLETYGGHDEHYTGLATRNAAPYSRHGR